MRELELAIAAEKDPAKREVLLQEARRQQMAAQQPQPPAAAAAQAPAPQRAPAAPVAVKAKAVDPIEAKGQAVDAAKEALAAAKEELRRYGSVQRSKDPDGYRKAKAAEEAARAAYNAADREWQQIASRAMAKQLAMSAP